MKYALYSALFAALLLFVAISPLQAKASGGCVPIYNGGATNQQYCPTPIPSGTATLSFIDATPTKAPQPTKGGFPVYPSAKTKSTPKTGPEDWALPLLALAGGIGFLLRKKTKLA